MVRISANIWEWWTTTGRQLQVRLGQRSLNWHVPCAAASRLAACLARDTQSFKFITSTKNTVTPGRQLRVRVVASTTTPSRQLHVIWLTRAAAAPARRRLLSVHICRGRVLNLKPGLFWNFNCEMCDSLFKLEIIGINLPVNLNLNFQTWLSEAKSSWTCFKFAGSTAAASRRPRRRGSDCQYRVVRMALAKWVTKRASCLKPAAVLRRHCSAAQTQAACVDSELSLDLNCPSRAARQTSWLK